MEELKNRTTTGERIHQIITESDKFSTSPRVRRLAAQHSHIFPKTLEKLASDTEIQVRCAVATNPKTPTTTLLTLCSDINFAVRESIIYNSKRKVVHENALLDCDDYAYIATEIAKLTTSVNILKRLAVHTDDGVRLCVVANPKFNEKISELFINENNDNVKMELVQRATTSIKVHKRIFATETRKNRKTNKESNIIQFMATNIDLPAEMFSVIAKQGKRRALLAVAWNKNLTTEALNILLNGEEEVVHGVFARRNDEIITPEILQNILNKNPDETIVRLVASNRKVSYEICETLLDHPDSKVRRAAVIKMLTSPSFIYKDWPEDWIEEHYNISLKNYGL